MSTLAQFAVALLMLALAFHGVWLILRAPLRRSSSTRGRRRARLPLLLNALAFVLVVRHWRRRDAAGSMPRDVTRRPTRL